MCYKVTEETAALSIIINLLIFFDNGGADFLKSRYYSNRLHPHTIEDLNLDTFFIRISNLTKCKGEGLGLPSCDAVCLCQSFPAQHYIPEDVGRLQTRCGNHESRTGKVISAPNRQKRRCITKWRHGSMYSYPEHSKWVVNANSGHP